MALAQTISWEFQDGTAHLMLTDLNTGATVTVPTQARESLPRKCHHGCPSREVFHWLMIQVLPEETTNPILPDHYIFFHHLPFQVTARPVSSSHWTIFIIRTRHRVTVMKSLQQLIHSCNLSRPHSI